MKPPIMRDGHRPALHSKDPEIPGLLSFKGELYRAAKWPKEPVSFAGKRVGVIGTGSTGIQIVQDIGAKCGELFVFQRTPSFTMPMRNVPLTPDYVAEVKRHYRAIREARPQQPDWRHPPAVNTRLFHRDARAAPLSAGRLLETGWPGHAWHLSDLLVNEEANEFVAEFVRNKISEVVKDPTQPKS